MYKDYGAIMAVNYKEFMDMPSSMLQLRQNKSRFQSLVEMTKPDKIGLAKLVASKKERSYEAISQKQLTC